MTIEVPVRDPCPFCGNLDGSFESAFVVREPLVSTFVNPRQYELGALIVVPNRHVTTLLGLSHDEIAAIGWMSQKLAEALDRSFPLNGLSVFQNNGVSSGQTVPHYHVHLVPQYEKRDAPTELYGENRFEKTPMKERLKIAARVQQALSVP